MTATNKPGLEVCLSPALLHLFDVKNSIVVIIDVLRATSTICTALYNGASRVIPVSSVEECVHIGRAIDGITAGERDGKVAEGLVHGNSPFEYPRDFIENKTLVLTTTNGTKLLHMAKDAIQIITGSFPNISAVCDYLIAQNKNVILGCAAWKDRVNMEDTLFAGAVVNRIKAHFEVNCDSAVLAESMYQAAQPDLIGFMKQASHYRRLANYGLEKDIAYCLTPDGANVLPLFKDGELIAG
ncbi:2-phosphosulfolactate phosphatase [Chitinophaga nivalis]|uniref:Probable 2-phosphosulfolactate phosphatase n=1 Tax=Chitinophaga nivalis TaxID=2991709 RepID=A0ABT3IUV2_9BACT|nr:2-phosphosulfolactate phosphatase [Chitinophaga nivalis]MCW3462556.1 2-phosphosulfolactate phosphatase [Chitinophaga nivalis]MCW3487753.1 2-phosphosulfolactate phosphatase [Chitinophaga nivalis]